MHGYRIKISFMLFVDHGFAKLEKDHGSYRTTLYPIVPFVWLAVDRRA